MSIQHQRGMSLPGANDASYTSLGRKAQVCAQSVPKG